MKLSIIDRGLVVGPSPHHDEKPHLNSSFHPRIAVGLAVATGAYIVLLVGQLDKLSLFKSQIFHLMFNRRNSSFFNWKAYQTLHN